MSEFDVVEKAIIMSFLVLYEVLILGMLIGVTWAWYNDEDDPDWAGPL